MTPNLRDQITSQNESVRIFALNHPELEESDKHDLIFGLTLLGISDPLFFEFLESNPHLVDAINPDVLVDLECPDHLKIMFVQHGESDQTLIRLLTMPGISKAVKDAFNSKIRDEKADSVIRKTFDGEAQEIDDKKFLEKYLQTKLPFYLPTFQPQDISKPKHRLGNLVGGIPFTNHEFPWPKCQNGYHMQPILQIDLTDAGAQLKINLGSGLVQVWAQQIVGGWPMGKGWPFNEDDENFVIRLIPESAFLDIIDEVLLKDVPWLISMEQLENEELQGKRNVCDHPCLMIHSESRISNPRIDSWLHFGSMYTPRYDNSTSMLGEPTFDFGCYFYSEFPVDSVPNPDSDFSFNSCYLGGYGGGNGGQNETYPLKLRNGQESRLLFNYRSEGDSYMAVTFSLYFAINDEVPTFGFHYYRYA